MSNNNKNNNISAISTKRCLVPTTATTATTATAISTVTTRTKTATTKLLEWGVAQFELTYFTLTLKLKNDLIASKHEIKPKKIKTLCHRHPLPPFPQFFKNL